MSSGFRLGKHKLGAPAHPDVEIVNPVDGEVITREESKWKNKPAAGGAAHHVESVQGTTDISTSVTAFMDMPDMTITANFGAHRVLIFFRAGINQTTGSDMSYENLAQAAILVDGVRAAIDSVFISLIGTNVFATFGLFCFETRVLSAGSHTIKVQWRSGFGRTVYNYAASIAGAARSLMVIELLA